MEAYEPSPLEMSGLQRTSIQVPPRLIEEAFGYKGDRRYVSFHWSPRFGQLFLCDGPSRVRVSDATAWPRVLCHPLIAPHLQHFTVDYKGVEAFDFSAKVVPGSDTSLFSSEDDARRMEADVVTSCLLLDRRKAYIYSGPWSAALTFHSLVSCETLVGDEPETPLAVGEPAEQLVTWLDKRLDDADQLFNLAATFHRFRQYQEALETLLRCVCLRPESDVFHFRLSQTYAGLGRWEEALTATESAARLQAEAVTRNLTPQAIFMWLGQCRFTLKRYAEAAEAYQLVVQIDPQLNGADAYHRLGRCYTKLGRHEEAIAAHQSAIGLETQEALYGLRGSDEDCPGEYDAELVDMDRTRIGESLQALGKAHLFAGELRKAEEAFGKALKTSPNSARGYAFLALAHDLMGKRSVAAEEFNISAARARLTIANRPDSPHGHADLALAYRMMGNDLVANEEQRRALDLGWRTDPDEDLFALVGRKQIAAS